MSWVIRPARPEDLQDLYRLTTLQSARGFLTLPSDKKSLSSLVTLSEKSFSGKLADQDQGQYLFVLQNEESKKVMGCSLILVRHGSPQSPHVYFEVDESQRTLKLKTETKGRTELGGLILDPSCRSHPEKLGKKLSYARLLYIDKNPEQFLEDLIAELLPPFSADGRSPLWEALGGPLTGLTYAEADHLFQKDKEFVIRKFPKGEVRIDDLPKEAQAVIGQAGPETKPVVKILGDIGFKYLHQIDPFDGGPHYGAKQSGIIWEGVEDFLRKGGTCIQF